MSLALLIERARAFFVSVSNDAHDKVDLLKKELKERRDEHRAVYTNTYRGIRREPGFCEYSEKSVLFAAQCEKEEKGASSTQITTLKQNAADLIESYRHAFEVKQTYDTFLDALAAKSGGKYRKVGLKHGYRSLEKMFLGGHDPLSTASVLDIVRGLIEFDGMHKMERALNYLFACDPRLPQGQRRGDYFTAAKDMPNRVSIRRVKDRMTQRTSGGWADCMINFSFIDDPNSHLCEIQLAHERLLTDRKEGGAHHGYNVFRAAFEI